MGKSVKKNLKMKNVVENDAKVVSLLQKADELVNKSITGRNSLTQDEIEDLRLELSQIRYRISRDIIQRASNESALRELETEDEITTQFGKYYKIYSEAKDDAGKLKYSKSGAESFARNTYKLKRNPVYTKKTLENEAKSFEKMLYQTLKGLDQVTNALSAISKRVVD